MNSHRRELGKSLFGTGGKRVLLAVGAAACFLLLGNAGAVAGTVGPVGPVLYFTEHDGKPSIERWNFTTFAPAEGDIGGDRQATAAPTPTFKASWTWYLPKTSMDWSIEKDDEWLIDAYIEGIDEILPLPGDLFSPTSYLGRHQIQVDLLASNHVFATGSRVIAPLPIAEGVQVYSIPLRFQDDHTFSGSGHLRLELTVTGIGLDKESPLRLHYGSSEHPSHIVSPGYPHHALRAMETGP